MECEVGECCRKSMTRFMRYSASVRQNIYGESARM